ncbi:ABC transporter ATP-binding protein [Ruegeria hyattellae]|uniref:ABC transporter ATP-binding protein n=1 Tax=Ruegeria hyattellae TaxID=3233337 RepID=UPI00355B979E
MARIELRNLKKAYGQVEVVPNMNLSMDHNEFICLVGPSGCGKSTTLRMIAGLEEISGGELLFDGERMNDVQPSKRDIAMVFQNYALYPHMKVRDNLSFGLKNAKMDAAEIDKRVQQAAVMLGLDDLLDRLPKALSGGQRQRVAMGRAVVRHPSVFLFDEPLSNLDAKLRTHMRGEIKKLHKKVESTIVYVTHDQTEAMTMADRIVVLRAGVIEQMGTPQELYDEPANVFVAGFIGSPAMNLVSGVVQVNGDQTHVRLDDGFILPIPRKNGRALNDGQAVVLGLRPDDITPQRAGSDDPNIHTVNGTVVVSEPTGAETYCILNFDGQELMCKSIGREEIVEDAVIPLGFDLSHIKVFDKISEQRIY